MNLFFNRNSKFSLSEGFALSQYWEVKMKNLNFADVAGIGASWGGAAAVAYFVGDPITGVIAIVAAYYLAKWIILKKD